MGGGMDLLSLMDAPASIAGASAAPPPGAQMVLPSAPTSGGPMSPASQVGVGAAHQPAPASASQVGGDPFVRVLSESRLTPDATEVIIFLEPTTGALRNLTLQVEPPPTLRVALAAPAPAAVTGARVVLPMLSPGGAARLVASVTCAAAVGNEVELLGQLVYSDAASVTEPRVVSFRIPVGLRSLLRPHPIATQDFGSLWPNHSAEKKITSPSPIATDPAAFMGMIENKLHIAPVQTIGMECIACGKLVGSAQTLLVHGKLGLMNGRAIELTLRSKDPRLTDGLLRAASEAVQAP